MTNVSILAVAAIVLTVVACVLLAVPNVSDATPITLALAGVTSAVLSLRENR